MECSMPGLPVLHYLPELAQTHVHWDTIQPISSSVIPFSSCIWPFPASGSFLESQFFASAGQSIGVSASASVLPIYIQDWFPLGLIALLLLQSKGLHTQSLLYDLHIWYDWATSKDTRTMTHWKSVQWTCLSLEKTLMLEMIESWSRRGWQRMRWLDGITKSVQFSSEA